MLANVDFFRRKMFFFSFWIFKEISKNWSKNMFFPSRKISKNWSKSIFFASPKMPKNWSKNLFLLCQKSRKKVSRNPKVLEKKRIIFFSKIRFLGKNIIIIIIFFYSYLMVVFIYFLFRLWLSMWSVAATTNHKTLFQEPPKKITRDLVEK